MRRLVLVVLAFLLLAPHASAAGPRAETLAVYAGTVYVPTPVGSFDPSRDAPCNANAGHALAKACFDVLTGETHVTILHKETVPVPDGYYMLYVEFFDADGNAVNRWVNAHTDGFPTPLAIPPGAVLLVVRPILTDATREPELDMHPSLVGTVRATFT